MSPPETRRPTGRRRASHSLESILTEAVAILDESGDQALTFRALAARLGGGVASIYWYVDSRDDLLERAADHVMADLVADLDGLEPTDDPVADLRVLAVRLFDLMVERQWLSGYFLRNITLQPHTMGVLERLGRQLLRLELTDQQRFDAVSAVIGYVVGTAIDLGQQPPSEVVDGSVSQEQYLARAAEEWMALDAEKFIFVRSVAGVFAAHDDRTQFLGGLDLMLEGLRVQAGHTAPRRSR